MKTTLQDAFENAGYETRSYSGRGMYGRSCLGIKCNSTEMFEMIAEAVRACATEDIEDLCNELKGGKTDNMGMGYILYFPQVKYDEDGTQEKDMESEDDA